jgi:hypothetical protein
MRHTVLSERGGRKRRTGWPAADFRPLPDGWLRRSPTTSSAAILAVALALGGCNANQGVNPAARSASGVAAGDSFPGYNPGNPITYAQTSGFYAGR